MIETEQISYDVNPLFLEVMDANISLGTLGNSLLKVKSISEFAAQSNDRDKTVPVIILVKLLYTIQTSTKALLELSGSVAWHSVGTEQQLLILAPGHHISAGISILFYDGFQASHQFFIFLAVTGYGNGMRESS